MESCHHSIPRKSRKKWSVVDVIVSAHIQQAIHCCISNIVSIFNEVRLDNGQTTLVLSGGAAIPTDAVTAVREGGG